MQGSVKILTGTEPKTVETEIFSVQEIFVHYIIFKVLSMNTFLKQSSVKC
jgi:hypothetical protein